MAIPSNIDEILKSAADNGLFNRLLVFPGSSVTPTAATANCGSVSIVRHPYTFTVPSVGTGFSGIWPVTANMLVGDSTSGAYILAAEYELGSLTVLGNTFSAGVTMPIKSVAGEMLQSATLLPMIRVSTAVTATTPVLTITYTDQDGNTGQTCTMTLPTSPVIHSAYSMMPHLANGDTGVRAVTNMSISTGSAGVIKAVGLLPIATSNANGASPILRSCTVPILAEPRPIYILEPNELVTVYVFDPSTSTSACAVHLTGVAA